MTGARVVRVVPDVPALDRCFDYVVPDHLAARVRVGTVVRVPLHGRRVGGWVVADGVTPPAGVRLHPLAKVTGWGPPAQVVELARWAAWRWAGRLRPLLRAASPPAAVAGLPPVPPPAARAGAGSGGDQAGGGQADAGTGDDEAGVLAAEALAEPRSVVRLAPGADPFPLVAAAAGLGPSLVLAPSGAEASELARRLRDAGHPAASLPREWARAAAGGCTVTGARGAAWAPLAAPAAVVVLGAHDEAYQEERSPTWDAWVVVAERARRAGVPCVLVSPCPTVEQLAWGRLVRQSRAGERAGWPALDVVDRRGDDPRSGLYSARLVRLLRQGGRVVCVLNRTGRARLLACAACAELARCERCQGAVAQHEDGLRCRRCGQDRPPVCQACGGARLRTLRVGVTRAGEELEALVGRPVGVVTAESGPVPDAGVLVGTEALLHRLGSADAAAFLDFDQELLAPHAAAGQAALALLARAARLVGGRSAGGRILVQTRLPAHEVLDAALHADPGRLAAVEAPRRAALRLPPAAALAALSGEGAAEFAAALPPSVERVGEHGGRLLVRAADHRALCDALAATPRPSTRLRVEVDPRRV